MKVVHVQRNAVFLLAILVASVCAFGQAKADPWLILPSGKTGLINAHTTRADLARTYGEANVVDQDVDTGEGEMVPGTVVFPKDPHRAIKILWQDWPKMTLPASAQIEGNSSRWHAAHGISLGTSLSELQRLNGRPFPISGYGTDQPGAILSWRDGSLEKDLQGSGHVILRLNCTPRKGVPSPDLSLIEEDSDDRKLQGLGLQVGEINWVFPTSLR